MTTPATQFLANFFKEDDTRYNVVYADRIVMERLPRQTAEILAKQMGAGYKAEPSK